MLPSDEVTFDPAQLARIVQALSAPDSPLRRSGAELVVDHVLALPIGELIDVGRLAPLYVEALSSANVERAIERHVLPGVERVRARLRDAGETVGDAVPPAARERIEELAAKPDGPRFAWMRGALDAAKLRDLLAPALQHTLLDFVRQLPLGAAMVEGAEDGAGKRSGIAAGLVGRLGREVQRGTERLVHVGRSVAGGLGVDLERRIQETARDFSEGAVAGLQRALRERAASPEGVRLLSGLSQSVVGHILATPVETIARDLDRLPLAAAIGLGPALISHNLSRELGRSALEAEIQAFLDVEGARSLREWLEEAGLLEGVRELAIERAAATSARLFASEGFERWLSDVLAAAK